MKRPNKFLILSFALSLVFGLSASTFATYCFAESEGNGKGNIDGDGDPCEKLKKEHPESGQQCQKQYQQQQQQADSQRQQVISASPKPERVCLSLAFHLNWSTEAATTACSGARNDAAPVACAYYAFSLDRLARAASDGMGIARLCAGTLSSSAPADCAEHLLDRGYKLDESILACQHARNAKRRIRCLERAVTGRACSTR